MRALILISITSLFFSCVKDKPGAAAPQVVPLSTEKKVYVVNEGNFGFGNASVSLYDPSTGNVIEDIYKSQNNAGLGDIVQSIGAINQNLYVVVNNSGKIVVCDPAFKKISEIKGLASPRYIVGVTPQKAYVSDYMNGDLHVINLNSNAKTGSIKCPGWTENMVMIYHKVFVTNLLRNYVYVINAVTDQVEDSIQTGPNCRNILLDNSDKVWVLSSGDAQNKIDAALMKIDPITNKIELNIPLTGYVAGNLCLNGSKDSLYFLNKDIYRMPVSAIQAPTTAFIQSGNRNYYGMKVSPKDHQVYLSDALDFSQRSNIYIYDQSGNQKTFFKAGVNSSDFYFE